MKSRILGWVVAGLALLPVAAQAAPVSTDYAIIGLGGLTKLSSFTVGVPGELTGNIAVTSGKYDISSSTVYGRIDCASATQTLCRESLSSSLVTGAQNYSVDFGSMLSSISDFNSFVQGATPILTIAGGTIGNRTDIFATTGIHIVNITSSLELNNGTWTINAAAGTTVVFLVSGNDFKTSNGNFALTGGIETGSVLFLTNSAKVDFSNTSLGGVSMWNLSNQETKFSNLRGCGQVMGKSIDLSNYSLTNCAFSYTPPTTPPPPTQVPEPAALTLLGSSLLGLWFIGRVRRRRDS